MSSNTESLSETASLFEEVAGGDGEGRRGALLCLALDAAQPAAPVPARFALADVDEVRVGRSATPRRKRKGRKLELGVPDRWMSSRHLQLRREGASWQLEDLGSKNGTRINGERVQSATLSDGDVISLGCTFWTFRADALFDASQAPDLAAIELERRPSALRTLSPQLERDYTRLERVASSELPVLITGGSGTGKELTARAVHERSGRRGRFGAINCGAISETLIESELFGAQKGAYTGATQREGLIRASDGGTLFLDEVAELPLASQAALLRVLQEKEVLPVGAARPLAVDVRVLAATHQDLPALVSTGRFRGDLFARLNGFCVALPALRERREDFGLLLRALLQHHGVTSLRLQPAAAEALLRRDWPFNVRELEQTIHAALAIADGEEIRLEDLPTELFTPPAGSAPAWVTEAGDRDETFKALLRRHAGNVSAVARELGTSRSQVRRLAERYGLDLSEFR